MATDVSSLPVNGGHAAHSGFDGSQAGYNTASQSYGQGSISSTQTQSAGTTSEIPKDEVGWYFVEQYYTTLSRSPEKLYLFYNKRSQFVLGDETDKVSVCVGQKAIHERIKDLEFQDCKVRVTNVDSQASDSNIVIQVIGEISNKSQPHRKFVQTFILAAQTNGYFVLNDIFRYLVDEEEEEAQVAEVPATQETGYQEPAPTATEQPSETLTSSEDPAAVEDSAKLVDQELESKAAPEEPAVEAPAVNGTTEAVPAATEESAAPADPVEPAVPSPAPVAEPEKPKEAPVPSPSPAKKAAQPAAAAPAPAPAKPSAPKTWANLAAAAHRVVTPAVPAAQPTPATPPTQPKAAATPAAQAPAQPAASAETAAPREPSPAAEEQDEWTSVGGHGRQQSRAQTSNTAQEGPQTRAYIKNVTENVDDKQLRSLLEKFGEIVYFDVSRQKNCAFVDFKTPQAYQAAVASNPHQLGSDRIVVEERRLKPGSYPYVQRGGMRGGRGAPGQSPSRGSFQGGRGGGYGGRGRGGAGGAPRGRGAQAS
ncbi:nuclear transport factor 2 domain-containing protein [Elsinoe australis]|uniref:Nuclear transport factor 2 domain-containing protein n=1 Tax=Elsinoe australis TaxID=40998 RepID=A0A4U7BB98_9PEZI|nr:nuclear transport factor 2 domain-containing protein [Elsinoe australis]